MFDHFHALWARLCYASKANNCISEIVISPYIFRHPLSMLEEGESYALKGAASVPGVFWKTQGAEGK